MGDDYYHNWRLEDVVQIYNSELHQYTYLVIIIDAYYNGTPRYTAHTINRVDYHLTKVIAEKGIKNGDI
ncbi:hypothetical protein JJB75_14335 [Clostridium perfringens]|uniref:hypothetical protein n=1 Tax=Clostridium perfringens TaxID=1502 RepID=UPI001ABAF66C|nr:hypothetical protein [Clostridium perfringens]MBO3304334.1 hypothetical protein [Clostridium perfringens]MBO3307654.1 hypothetical protein [Clostridium perfringens]MBO3311028.1 hypothetical protein [Clostridium perfringens]MBO3317288.1 hypothetical protein [Clostridium perfringens]